MPTRNRPKPNETATCADVPDENRPPDEESPELTLDDLDRMAGDDDGWAEFDEWIRAMSDVLIKLTGLWERTRRGNTEGQFYLVGQLGAAKILAFKNHRKESDADPDWNLLVRLNRENQFHRFGPATARARYGCSRLPDPLRLGDLGHQGGSFTLYPFF